MIFTPLRWGVDLLYAFHPTQYALCTLPTPLLFRLFDCLTF